MQDAASDSALLVLDSGSNISTYAYKALTENAILCLPFPLGQGQAHPEGKSGLGETVRSTELLGVACCADCAICTLYLRSDNHKKGHLVHKTKADDKEGKGLSRATH